MKVPVGFVPYGIKGASDGRVFYMLVHDLRHGLGQDVIYIFDPGKPRGGWAYRSEWAAAAAFDQCDATEPPMAGEWMDFK